MVVSGADPEAFSGCDTKAKEDNEVILTEDDMDDPMVKIDLNNLAKYRHDHLKASTRYAEEHKYRQRVWTQRSQPLQNYGL